MSDPRYDYEPEEEEPPTEEELALEALDAQREWQHERGLDADYPDGIDEWSAH